MAYTLTQKQEALRTLIKHSYFLEQEAKELLVQKIPALSEQEIDILGKFLALEKAHSLKIGETFLAE